MATKLPLCVRYCVMLVLTFACQALSASEFPQGTRAFLSQNCYDCHQGKDAEAGLDLKSLGTDLSEHETRKRWERIFDRVHDGEMPPRDAGDVDVRSSANFVQQIGRWIKVTQQAEQAKLGRVRARRLTNIQLERTLHDLLGIDTPLAQLMTEEQRTDGFTNIADGQPMSHFHLESHLTVIDAALDAAFDRVTDSPKVRSKDFNARAIARRNPRQRCRDPEMYKGLAVTWTGRTIFYGRITSSTIPNDGWYRITFTASALNQPKNHGVWCSVRSGRCTSGAPLLSWIGSFEATKEPKELSYEAWIPKGHMLEIRPADSTLKTARFAGGQIGAGEGAPQNVPGLGLHKMVIERIHPGGDLQKVKRLLFGQMKVAIDDRTREIKFAGDDATKEAAKQLRFFARRAFRRPATEEQLQPFLQLLRKDISEGQTPVVALRNAYRALLCSPRFIYFHELPGQLDDYAIASRLSYMLTGSSPDYELHRLAREGKLRDGEVRSQQVDRLLNGKKLDQFVTDLADQWLDLSDIDFTEPDRRTYPTFDIVVQNSMVAETHLFLKHLIQNNLAARTLVDADFTFLNSRLARFYGIEGEFTNQLRRTKLPNDSRRGGLLSQGAILKVTANGTNTSPVVRGVWVSERILGQKIPPPPENVPAIEPDVRGTKTIREMLAKHRDSDACASCHRKIDPAGFALENFDAAGLWRDHYLKPGSRKAGMRIDASYELTDGREFNDFNQFRKLVASDEEMIAHNFAEKLLVFGTGSPIQFADRDSVRQIVKETEKENYGIKSLIHAVVSSPIFLKK